MYIGHHHLGRHDELSKPGMGRVIICSSLIRGKIEGLLLISPDDKWSMCLHHPGPTVLTQILSAPCWDDIEALAVVNGGTMCVHYNDNW